MSTSRWHTAGLTACFGLMLVVNLQSVSEDFLYGHKGWCAARRAVAGRNFVREGFAATRFGPVENTTPTVTPDAYKHYWHHPVGIHLLVGVSFSLFGVGEWQARLVPILLMLASFLLFADLAKRWWPSGPGRWAAMVFFATTPMLAYYGPFVNQEPLVLLACLASVWTYTRWGEAPSRGWLAASATVAFVSAWSDWPWFIFAFCLAVIAAAAMLRRRALDLRWFAPFCMAVLLGFGAVLWHLSILQGGDDFFGAFSDLGSFRHSGKGKTIGDVFARQTAPWLDLFTPTLALAAIIWPLRAALDARRGRWSDKHSVAVAFLILGGAWIAIFKHGAWVHDFWPMFAGVYAVIAGADLVVDLGQLASKAGGHWPGGRWSRRLAAGVAAGLILTQGAAGLAGTSHRVRFADPNPKEGEDFRHRHAVMARWVHDHTDPNDEIALDQPIFKATFQLGFYLDRKRRKIRIKENTRSLRVRTKTKMAVIDLRRAPQVAARSLLVEAVGRHPVTLLDDFLIVDRRRRITTPEVTCLRLEDAPASWLHTWLVSAIYPPQTLVREPWLEADLLRVTGHTDLALARRGEAPPPKTARQHVAAHNLARLAGQRPPEVAAWLSDLGTVLDEPTTLGKKLGLLGYTTRRIGRRGEVVEAVFRVQQDPGAGWRPFFNRHSEPGDTVPMVARAIGAGDPWAIGELILVRTYAGLDAWGEGTRYQMGFWRPGKRRANKGSKAKRGRPPNQHLMVGKERGAWVPHDDWHARAPLPWTLRWIPHAKP